MAAPNTNGPRALPPLSGRERQLLMLAGEGCTDAEIALRLGISTATINVYWTRLRTKIGARSRTEAVAMSIRDQAENDHRKLELQFESARQKRDDEQALAASICALVEDAPDGILVCDASGSIIYANSAFSGLFGYGQRELIGAHVSLLIPERYREGHKASVLQFAEHPEPRRMGHGLFVRGVRKDGREVFVCVTLSSFRRGSINHILAMVRDYSLELEKMLELHPGATLDDLEG